MAKKRGNYITIGLNNKVVGPIENMGHGALQPLVAKMSIKTTDTDPDIKYKIINQNLFQLLYETH